jgi:hypothetical protein
MLRTVVPELDQASHLSVDDELLQIRHRHDGVEDVVAVVFVSEVEKVYVVDHRQRRCSIQHEAIRRVQFVHEDKPSMHHLPTVLAPTHIGLLDLVLQHLKEVFCVEDVAA